MEERNNRKIKIKAAFRLSLLILFLLHPLSHPTAHAQLADARIQLGKQLFFDPRLSDDLSMSCTTCHQPDRAFTDGRTHAVGIRGKRLERNTPTLLHVGKLSSLFWDGRATTLEDQVRMHLQDPDIMNMSPEALVNRLQQVPGYVKEFKTAYASPVTWPAIAKAISSFERTLGTRSAPIDHFYVGRNRAISITAQRGMELFRGKGRCAFCHKGYDFTDSGFHNIGVPSKPHFDEFSPFFFLKSNSPLDNDVGRYRVTHREEDRHAFKTPTLRNITETGPYMHNGVFKTLREVMEFYNHGGVRNANLDMEMKPIKMSSLEIQDLLDFMETLKGEIPAIEKPELP